MIDLHCHILPGLDDGAQDKESSLDMARLAVEEGITHILATPHHKKLHWSHPKNIVVEKTNELQDRLDEEGIPLTIFPGQELHLHGTLMESIERDEICFIDEFEQYILVEFPSTNIPEYADRLFFELQSEGITPIIVHPELNKPIQKDPSLLYDFATRGILAQVTAGSYIGKLGKDIEKLSHQLIEANLVHFLASDAHNTTSRPFYMKKAIEKLEKEFGSEKVEAFDQMTRNLVNGDPVTLFEPQPIKVKKRFFGLF